MKYRHKASGKTYSSDDMQKMRGGKDHKDADYEEMEEKSDLSEDELRKALDALEDIADSETPESRRDALMAKALDGGIDEEENAELRGLLGGENGKEPGLGDFVRSQLDPSEPGNEPMAKALDVSKHLNTQHQALVKAIGTVADYLEQHARGQHQFNVVLAKAMKANGDVSLSVKESVDQFLDQPVAGPKAAGLSGAKPMNKSFAGQQPEGEQLTKSQITTELRSMYDEAIEKGQDQRRQVIGQEIVKFESAGQQISGKILKEVQHRIAN